MRYPTDFYCSEIYCPEEQDKVLIFSKSGVLTYDYAPTSGLYWWKPIQLPIQIKSTKSTKLYCKGCGVKLAPAYFRYTEQYLGPTGYIDERHLSLCFTCVEKAMKNGGEIIPTENGALYASYVKYVINKVPKNVGYLDKCSTGSECSFCDWVSYCENTKEKREARFKKDKDQEEIQRQLMLQKVQQETQLLEEHHKDIIANADLNAELYDKYWVQHLPGNYNFITRNNLGGLVSDPRVFIDKETGFAYYFKNDNTTLGLPELDPIGCPNMANCTPLSCLHCRTNYQTNEELSIHCEFAPGIISGLFDAAGVKEGICKN
jgi:hypothetical protein